MIADEVSVAMKRKRAPFEAARSGDAMYVRIHGLGSMTNAPALEVFAERAIEEGARRFVFDLAACDGVDSTFMGLILSLSNRLREEADDLGGIVLINVDDHCRKQLSSVGVDAFVSIKDGATSIPSALKLTELATIDVSERERLKLMLRAHKELVAADVRNKAKFGAFLDGIVAELG